MTPAKLNIPKSSVAIIGMACIFPESRTLKEYWHMLFNGIDAISPIPEDSHWKLADYFNPDPACPDHTYCNRGGFIPEIAFDPMSFGIPPNNLQATDTSQLLGLEVAKRALEDAGYAPGHPWLETRKVNVILGVTGTQELVIPLGARLGHPYWKQALEDAGVPPQVRKDVMDRIEASYVQWQENSFPGLLGNVVAGRIANRLNLSGTNAVSDAACASSLSAVHTAVMELQAGRCDMSITGGVDTLNDIFMHMCFSKTGVLSHTSDAKPFSKDADGTVLGEGIGMLVLKRLEDAKRDQDRIYAVIKGIGTSSDGRTSAVYAPESKGQLRALNDAYARAGVDPATVGLIEAHGTGTRVGDKVEFTALRQCFEGTGPCQSTAIGSVKSMIGHAKAAAGAAGLIKTALALHHKVLPPTLKAGEPDPDLDIETSSFYLNDQAKPWVAGPGTARRSGVSAFGFGGSNFHAVLEEYAPEKTHVSWDGSVQIFAFSGPDKKTVCEAVENTKNKLCEFEEIANPAAHAQAVAWQAAESRQGFSTAHDLRVLAVYSRGEDVHALLDNTLKAVEADADPKPPIFIGNGSKTGKLGFVFPGQGSQYPGMARELMAMFPEGATALDLVRDVMERIPEEGLCRPDELINAMYPLPAYAADKKETEARLRQTQIAQPAIGAVSMAMTNILRRFGITPDVTCGHSFGELSALYAAGWMDKTDFLTLSAARGHYMAKAGEQSGDSGSMLAVRASVSDINALIKEEKLDLVLANINSPAQGVLSGSTPEIERAQKCCKQRKMRAVRLPVAAAFHSRLVADAALPFQDLVQQKKLHPSEIAVLSNTTGSDYPETETAIKALLGDQLVHPVNFTDNIQAMTDKGVTSFIEVGPKTVLSGLVRSIVKDASQPVQIQAMDDPGSKHSGIFGLAQVLSLMAACGHPVDLRAWEDPAAKPVLPKMAVMLNGANLKPAPQKRPAPKPQESKTQDVKTQGSDMTPHPDLMRSFKTQTDHRPKEQSAQPQARPEFPAQPTPVQGNSRLIQQGLEAMQQLQAQTARVHEKFLETQAQASRTLAEIMAQTRGEIPVRYAAPVTPAAAPPQATYEFEPAAAPKVSAPAPYAAPTADIVSEPPPEQPAPPVAASPKPVIQQPDQNTSAASATGVQSTLFDIVSRLTGFPEEMLELQMDIESDLGIDSIKKVEIISELEKALPEGSGLSSDHLTSVRTLEDICSALGHDSANQPSSAVASTPAAPEVSGETAPHTMAVLIKIISDLTGFPEEMLEPEMDLESDLGIDSIKRVEILSRLEQELPDIESISPDDMGTLKRLGDIVSFLTPAAQPAADSGPAKKKTPSATRDDELGAPSPAASGPLLRQEVVLKSYPVNQIRFYNGARIEVDADRTVYLTRDSAGVAQAFASEFEALGIKTAFIVQEETGIPDLSDAAGIVIVPDVFESGSDAAAQKFLTRAFDLARTSGGPLMEAAETGGAFFATVTFSGGSFGFHSHSPEISPVYGGLSGLAKTADIEWKKVLCRALDLSADPEQCKANAEAAVALMMTHGAVEMGIDGDHCLIPELQQRKVSPATLDMGTDDVVVITGGAKGVTFECALALARSSAPKIALWGRSPAVFEEPDWLVSLRDAADIKQGILKNEFADQKPKPAQVQDRYRAIMSNRAIRENLDRISAFSPEVRYYSVDIRDKEAVFAAMQDVADNMGPVTALIHGAGVLEDKLIVEKQPEQFQRVFETKVSGLDNLFSAAGQDDLRYVVLFSSVAARYGNQGQCDYAMANEVLNKTAQNLSRTRPGCRCLSINWGPWDGGMVDASLKKEFERRGIDLIPQDLGAEQMVQEMAGGTQVEIVIGAGLRADTPEKAPILTTAMERPVGTMACPILAHHRIDHQPVVPLAMMADLMAHAAEKNNPGLAFSGMDGMRLLKGILPGDDDMALRVELSRCVPQNGVYTVSARLSSVEEDSLRPHAQGILRLRDSLSKPPVLSKAAFMDLKASSLSPARAYDSRILFHGPALQCIEKINGVSAKGIDVIARCGQGPDTWYTAPHAKQWSLDPLMLDAAFQAAILWTYENKGAVCLPNAWESLRIYSSYPMFAAAGGDKKVRIMFTVNHNGRHRIQGYFTFLDSQDTVIASIMGFEALTDKNLLEKFKSAPLYDRDKILAFAQGNPSEAFGPEYKVFDSQRQIARLPRPPYFFMDRVTRADHRPWEMTPAGWIEAEYEIPREEWYFKANRTQAMPFCILLEIALQPCGWLAAYAGSALHSDDRLHFRNLGGKATLLKNPTPNSGTLTVKSRMTEVSKAGGMIIQDFDMQVLIGGEMIYQGTTNFGFFTGDALANQVGIRTPRFYTEIPEADQSKGICFEPSAPITPDDPNLDKPSKDGMPATAIRMIDRIDYLDFDAGCFNQGLICGTKTVNPKEWFFDAHFYQDPVCPGSLGIESFIQLLRYFIVQKHHINAEAYEVRMTEPHPHEWIYRGQIIPSNKTIKVQAHISSCEKRKDTFSITASGALVVDDICIYEFQDFSLEFVPAMDIRQDQ